MEPERVILNLLFGAAVLLGSGRSSQAQQPVLDSAAAFFDDREVREIRLYFDDANWYNTLLRAHENDPADPYFPCRFRSGDVSIDKIGCRFKGNSSFRRNGIKKPFKLDFNEYDDNATFMGLKKLNLNNFDLQPDFLREKLLHDLAGRHIAALRSVYVKLYINDALYGLYLAVEQPDMTMMRSRWGPGEDGNLYEAEEQMGTTSRPVLAWLGEEQSVYQKIYLLKSNEEKNDYSRLIQFLNILNNTPAAQLRDRLEAVADIENWMQAMAVNNLVVNLDSYLGVGAEYYLYDRTADGRFIHIQWDHNESFGITGDGTPRLATPATTDPFWLPTAGAAGSPGGGPSGNASSARPLLEKMWSVEEFKRVYLRAMARFLREGFNPDATSARVSELATLIRAHVVADPNKAYTAAQFETALNSAVGAIPGINQFVRERHSYLRNYLNGQAQAVDIRLNEIGPAGAGSARDEAGDADAWVEIHNLGPGPMSLNGFFLSDDAADVSKWALPNVTLADGEYLVVWLDGETAEGASHASFAIPAAGGKLFLFSRNAASPNEPTDTVTIQTLLAGQTQVRGGLYGSFWSITTAATPAAANRFQVPAAPVTSGTGQLLITELMADNGAFYPDPEEPGAFEDWFEIYNPGGTAVDMSGMYISDNPNNPTKWKVPEGVTILSGEYLVFLADSEPAQGPRHTSWGLSADGESLLITAADGATLIDSVTFGPQERDVPYGRVPSEAGTWSKLSTATPGAANAPPREQ
jgi:spore coat protein CotH